MPIAGLLEERVGIPAGVQVTLQGATLTVSAKGKTLQRTLAHPKVSLRTEGDAVVVTTEFPTKREKALVGTFAAHVGNMIVGVTDGFTYEMKIVYSHFPMKASVKGPEFVIENFLGEKHPRRAKILGDTKVEVSGDQVILKGTDIEKVSQTAANIEQATRIRGFDPRIFQDGIYITKKAGEG
ncbi:MAG: 50S ribosomal protein L6 [Euryarchaeota archaeon RBG_16_68_13]|nr:large subunit ribosomal protein L6 [uncultured archaeon]OGS48117.1 MAG: 50S ribosomal protein L6 [Euryarchaeota archaeon RBG_16_68_13]